MPRRLRWKHGQNYKRAWTPAGKNSKPSSIGPVLRRSATWRAITMAKVFPGLADATRRQRGHHIEDVILPKLGGIPARDLNGADVVSLLEAVGAKSVPVAGLVFVALNALCKHGIARHVMTANPLRGAIRQGHLRSWQPKAQTGSIE